MDKLTAKEKKWVAEVQEVLDRCPSDRLQFFTIGDPNIGIYLKKREVAVMAYRGDLVTILQENDWLIAEVITFPAPVEGVCG